MNISFPDVPGVATIRGTVAFPALYQGRSIACEISAEALQKHFHATGYHSSTLCAAFDRNRERIELKAGSALHLNNCEPVLLTSEDFYSDSGVND